MRRVQGNGQEVLLHELHTMEWIDSPEYIARQTSRGATFQVLIRALPASNQPPPSTSGLSSSASSLSLTLSSAESVDACRVLVLPYGALQRVYGKLPHLRGVMECVVARDVTHKLFATGEAVRGVQKLSATIDEQKQQAETEQLPQHQPPKVDEEKKDDEG